MADLLTQGQPARRSIMSPASGYSRVVSVLAYIKFGAVRDWVMTPVLGNRVRLLRVKAWSTPLWDSVGNTFSVWFRVGPVQPVDWAAFGRFRRIIPCHLATGEQPSFDVHMEKFTFDQSMDQLYQGDEIRFGLGVEVSPGISILLVYAFFEISEG